MKNRLHTWLKSGKYLPPALRDFHDQKDVFKAIRHTTDVDGHAYCKEVDWFAGRCYVIDIFLWWMAKHGYTLQRTRKKLEFDNLDETVTAVRNERTAAFMAALTQRQK